MNLYKVLSVLAALNLATFAAADDVDPAATADTRSIDAKAGDDDMTDFLAIVTDALAESDDATSAKTAADVTPTPGGRLQRHLGLGFASGLTSQTPLYQHNDDCRGNGHSEGYGDGFGYRDCGDPSPSE